MKFIRKEGKLQTTPTNTTFLPPPLPPHFSRAHAVPWTLNFFPLILPLCARLNSISIHAHAKSAPNSLFDPVRATIIYIYTCIYVYVQRSYLTHLLTPEIPSTFLESIRIFLTDHRSYSAQLRNIRYSLNAADVHLALLHRSLLYWNIVSLSRRKERLNKFKSFGGRMRKCKHV